MKDRGHRPRRQYLDEGYLWLTATVYARSAKSHTLNVIVFFQPAFSRSPFSSYHRQIQSCCPPLSFLLLLQTMTKQTSQSYSLILVMSHAEV